MTPPNPLPASIDYAALTFPSDRITIADLRRVHSNRFDGEGVKRFESAALNDLDAVFFAERLLARAAFEKAQGKSGNVLLEVGFLERDAFVEDLTRFYKIYGLAEGAKHTEQLVREIESQAAAQAGRKR